jgi:hypothetical protein
MTRRRQSKGKTRQAQRASRTTQSAAKNQPARKGQVRAWFAGVLAAVIAATSPVWAPALTGSIEGLFTSDSPGPPLTVTAEPAVLDDQGYTMATPDGALPGPQLRQLMTQDSIADSPKFLSAVQAMGGADVDDLTIQLIVNGNSAQGVRILDIRPVRLQRAKPLGGTLFDTPPQAGTATLRMMFDLDEPVPIARNIGDPSCPTVTQGDTVHCVVTNDPYPQQPGGDVYPGSPFFDNETIHLDDHEQQVLNIRAQATRSFAAFDVEIYYIVGNASGDIHQLVVSDHGRPFRVTGMPPGAKPGTVSYQAAYLANAGNYSMCPMPDPHLIAMTGTKFFECPGVLTQLEEP